LLIPLFFFFLASLFNTRQWKDLENSLSGQLPKDQFEIFQRIFQLLLLIPDNPIGTEMYKVIERSTKAAVTMTSEKDQNGSKNLLQQTNNPELTRQINSETTRHAGHPTTPRNEARIGRKVPEDSIN
jgi:hypothetical protein